MIDDSQELIGAKVRGHDLRTWDEGFGPLWLYSESLGPLGVVRAMTWEEAFECVVDEIMDDADDEQLGEAQATEETPEGCHWRGGTPSNPNLESPLAQSDLNGCALEQLTPQLAGRLEIELELSPAVKPHDDETIPPGCVRCTVEYHAGSSWLVRFEDNATLLLQSDYDQAAFAVACGVIKAASDWDGCPTTLGKAFCEVHPNDIAYCPDDYLELAEAQR